jgi:F0F1-type ATP synthase epsilon subunit
MANNYIKIRVRDLQRVVFEGEVDRISSYNEIGPFDVYQMHANFISIIRKELTLYKDNEKVKDIKLEKAVMKVKKDKVKVFLGIDTINSDEDGIQNTPKPESQK